MAQEKLEVSFKTAVAHGVSQGALTRIQGGSFKSGFLGGSIGSYSGTFMNKESGWTNITKRTAIAATAGGIASELGGGKFANGARSAAFVHLFNAEGSNIVRALVPNSIAVPGFEGKLGFASLNVSPASLEANMTNHVNAGYPVFSNTYSGTIGGLGIQAVRYSYDLTQTWTNFNYSFKSDFGASSNGAGIYYHGGFGFRRGGLDYQYDFKVPIIRPAY